MSKVIFRRIAGRLVPIKIGPSVKAYTPMGYLKSRILPVKIDGHQIGQATFGIPLRGLKKFRIGDVEINKEFRKKGIGTAVYKYIAEIAERAGIRKMDSTQIIGKGAIKARARLDTDFFRRQPSGRLRKISKERALELLPKKVDIRASTKIPRKYRK